MYYNGKTAYGTAEVKRSVLRKELTVILAVHMACIENIINIIPK